MKSGMNPWFWGLVFLLGCMEGAPSFGPVLDSEAVPLRIGLQPLGAFPAAALDSVANRLRVEYSAEVILLPVRDLPAHAFTTAKSPRYRADSLIRWLHQEKADSLDLLLGLTGADLSFTKRDADGEVREPAWKYQDWGIMGLGFRPGNAAVASTFRLGKSPVLRMERLVKVATHEVGHNLGLPHCQARPDCVMRDAAESVKTLELVRKELCMECRKRVFSTSKNR